MSVQFFMRELLSIKPNNPSVKYSPADMMKPCDRPASTFGGRPDALRRHKSLKRFDLDMNRGGFFDVSASTAIRLAANHRDRGVITPKREGRAPGTEEKLAPHRAFLVEIVCAGRDITLKEFAWGLEQTHGKSVQLSSIHRALVRAVSYIKKPDRAGARPGGYQAGPA